MVPTPIRAFFPYVASLYLSKLLYLSLSLSTLPSTSTSSYIHAEGGVDQGTKGVGIQLHSRTDTSHHGYSGRERRRAARVCDAPTLCSSEMQSWQWQRHRGIDCSTDSVTAASTNFWASTTFCSSCTRPSMRFSLTHSLCHTSNCYRLIRTRVAKSTGKNSVHCCSATDTSFARIRSASSSTPATWTSPD